MAAEYGVKPCRRRKLMASVGAVVTFTGLVRDIIKAKPFMP